MYQLSELQGQGSIPTVFIIITVQWIAKQKFSIS
jgi:hypothetical protein